MLMAKVLLTSDDSDSVWIWGQLLGQKGLDVVTIKSRQETLDQIKGNEVYDLVVIDENSSQLNGIQLIRQFRYSSSVPILLLVNNRDESKALEAYEAGVDEYILKPIGPRLFAAKVKAWLSRTASVPTQMQLSFQVGDLMLDPAKGQIITHTGATIKLTNLEFRLMHLLMSHPGQTIDSNTIIRYVWGYAAEGDSTLIKNVVYRLRRKIEPDPAQPSYILLRVGEGYLFRPKQQMVAQQA